MLSIVRNADLDFWCVQCAPVCFRSLSLVSEHHSPFRDKSLLCAC